MSEPLVKFRISAKFPDKKLNTPFLFVLWRSQKEMYEHNDRFTKDYYAITIDTGIIKNKKTSKTIEIHLPITRVGVTWSVHEIFHAVAFFANRNNLIMQSKDGEFMQEEELCARLTGDLTRKFYRKLRRLKIVDFDDIAVSKEYNHKMFELK